MAAGETIDAEVSIQSTITSEQSFGLDLIGTEGISKDILGDIGTFLHVLAGVDFNQVN